MTTMYTINLRGHTMPLYDEKNPDIKTAYVYLDERGDVYAKKRTDDRILTSGWVAHENNQIDVKVSDNRLVWLINSKVNGDALADLFEFPSTKELFDRMYKIYYIDGNRGSKFEDTHLLIQAVLNQDPYFYERINKLKDPSKKDGTINFDTLGDKKGNWIERYLTHLVSSRLKK